MGCNDRQRQVLNAKVRQMANLPVGFSHGEGIGIAEAAIEGAEALILLASENELEADVFPNLDGGCSVGFYKDLETIEVSIGPEGGLVYFTFERGIGFEFQDVIPPVENIDIAEVRTQLFKLKG